MVVKVTARASRPALPFLPTTDMFFTLLRASCIFAALSTCFSVDQYVFNRSHWAGCICTGFLVSPARYLAFNLNLSDFRNRLTEFLNPCILKVFPRYSNSESRRSRSFYTASTFCPSHCTILMSRSRGTKLRTASSQPFFPWHAPSISPPNFTVTCFAFRPADFRSASMLSLCLRFLRR
jgi:hypothetical protein